MNNLHAQGNQGYYNFPPQTESYQKRKEQYRDNTPPPRSQYKGEFPESWYKKHNKTKNYYISIDLGYNFGTSVTATNNSTTYNDGRCNVSGGCTTGTYAIEPGTTINYPGNTNFDIDFDGNVAFGLRFGISYYEQYRLESQLAVKRYTFDSITPSLAAISNYGSNSSNVTVFETDSETFANNEYTLDAISLMFNGYYDMWKDKKLRPYLGMGIGGSNISTDGFNQIYLSYQISAGASYKFNKNIYFYTDLNYLYSGTIEYDFDVDLVESANDNSITNTYNLEQDYDALTLLVGYRFLFDAID